MLISSSALDGGLAELMAIKNAAEDLGYPIVVKSAGRTTMLLIKDASSEETTTIRELGHQRYKRERG